MGRPKASLHVEGLPLIARVARALRSGGVHDVVVIGGDAELGALAGGRWAPDAWPGEGPLAGIATAAQHVGPDGDLADIVVVAACDQPDLPGSLVAELVAALRANPHAMAALVATPDGRQHPLPVALRAVAGPLVVEVVEGGARRADVVATLGPTIVVTTAAWAVDDLDTPADLAARRAAGSPPGATGFEIVPDENRTQP